MLHACGVKPKANPRMEPDEKQKSYWIKSGAYSLMSILSQLAFGMGSMLILVRMLDKPTFGLWAIYMVTTTFVEVPRAGLIQNGLLTYLSTEPRDAHGRIMKASLVLNLLFTAVVGMLLFWGGPWMAKWQQAPVLKDLLWIYVATSFVLIPFFNLNYIQQAYLDFRGIFWSTFVRFGTFFGYNLYHFVKHLPVRLEELVLMQLVSAGLASLVSILFTRAYFVHTRGVDWSWVRRLADYGKFVFGTNLATMLHKKADVMLLGSMLSKAASALQDVAVRITYLIEAPTLAAAGVVFPQSARAMAQEGSQGVKLLYEKVVGIIVGMLLPFAVFVWLFPKLIIGIIAGPAYYEAADILRITVTFGLIIPFGIQFGTILDSTGLPKINFFYTLAGGLLNVFLVALYVRHFGVIGAAYAGLTSYSIMLFFQLRFLRKRYGVRLFNVFGHTFAFYRELPSLIMRLRKRKAA